MKGSKRNQARQLAKAEKLSQGKPNTSKYAAKARAEFATAAKGENYA